MNHLREGVPKHLAQRSAIVAGLVCVEPLLSAVGANIDRSAVAGATFPREPEVHYFLCAFRELDLKRTESILSGFKSWCYHL